jgi:hypothetical protein
MTREEADGLMTSYDEASWTASQRPLSGNVLRFQALRDRIIDRLCGEEPTDPTGREP